MPIDGDPAILHRYTIAILSLLATAGLALLIADRLLHRNVASIWATWRGWCLIVPPVLGALWLGRPATIVGLVIVSVFAFKELARATGLYRDWWLVAAVYVAIAGVGAVTLVTDPRLGVPGWYGMFMALPVYSVALILMIPVLRNRTEGQLQGVSLAALGFLYIGWMFLHLAFLANLRQALGMVLYLICAVQLNDIAAFTSGKLFGRKKLREAISPNKTWAGAIGALLFSLALPWLLRFSLPQFGALQLLLTGLIVGLGGQLGDLTISFIKRDLRIKDMGAAIPGHGGLLDRIDSLIYTAPLFFHMARWFGGAPGS